MIYKIFIVVISIILLLSISWSPWITNAYAEKVVSDRFTAEWDGIMDGCGLNCNECGIKESQRSFFGVNVKMEYACGMSPHHQIDTVFVSFLGTVHGLKES